MASLLLRRARPYTLETLDDTFVHGGQYLMLQRVVEMYAWEEESRSTTTKHSDGSSTTRTTYSYTKNWTSSPEDSRNFERELGHQNSPMVSEGSTLYRAFTSHREQAIGTMNTEYTIMLWVLRLAGFLMMWFGMFMCFGPLSTMLNLIPLIGTLSNVVLGAVLLPIALTLTLVTIITAIIAHNPLLLIGVLLLGGGGIFAWSRMRQPWAQAIPA